MKTVMELRFTELGAIGLSVVVIYMAAGGLLFDRAALEASSLGWAVKTVVGVCLLFGMSMYFYVVYHALVSGRLLWFIGVLFWPFSLVYWWRHIRPQLMHDAQQRVPADGPASRARG